MKRVAVLLLSILLLTTMAFAENLDYAGMSFDELIRIRTDVESEITNRLMADQTILYEGAYAIGEDIKSGDYLFTCTEIWEHATSMWVSEYDGMKDCERKIRSGYTEVRVGETIRLKLVDGKAIRLECGKGSIRPYALEYTP